jgi:hypothetical protein
LNWNLDFSHYVTVSGLPEELQEELLDVAESGNYAVEDLLLSIADMKGKSVPAPLEEILEIKAREADPALIAMQTLCDRQKGKATPEQQTVEAFLNVWHPSNRRTKNP